jgi:hypothetical protein
MEKDEASNWEKNRPNRPWFGGEVSRIRFAGCEMFFDKTSINESYSIVPKGLRVYWGKTGIAGVQAAPTSPLPLCTYVVLRKTWGLVTQFD